MKCKIRNTIIFITMFSLLYTTLPVSAATYVLDDGIFTFRNVNSQINMDANLPIYEGHDSNITQEIINGNLNQQWKLEYAGDGYYYIRSAYNENLVMDVYYGGITNGTNIILADYHGGDNQKFEVIDNCDFTVQIRPLIASDKCVEVYEASTSTGANIVIWDYNGGLN